MCPAAARRFAMIRLTEAQSSPNGVAFNDLCTKGNVFARPLSASIGNSYPMLVARLGRDLNSCGLCVALCGARVAAP